MSGLLCLKWNNHTSAFLKKFSNLRAKNLHCDATIVCCGKYFRVHRLILSTCSEYFEEIFENVECKHPFILLKDVTPRELEALLNYMYMGEVNVLQDVLPDLIKAAEALKIKGLAVSDSDIADTLFQNCSRKRERDEDSCSPSPSKRDKENDSSVEENVIDEDEMAKENIISNNSSMNNKKLLSNKKAKSEIISNVVKVEPDETILMNIQSFEAHNADNIMDIMYGDDNCKSNDDSSQHSNISNNNFDQPHCSSWERFEQNSDDMDGTKTIMNQAEVITEALKFKKVMDVVKMTKRKSHIDKYHCPICSYSSVENAKMERHIRCVHTQEKPFHCTYCSYKTGDKSCLRKHLFIHTGKPYQCKQCTFSSTQANRLHKHIETAHGSDMSNDNSNSQLEATTILTEGSFSPLNENTSVTS